MEPARARLLHALGTLGISAAFTWMGLAYAPSDFAWAAFVIAAGAAAHLILPAARPRLCTAPLWIALAASLYIVWIVIGHLPDLVALGLVTIGLGGLIMAVLGRSAASYALALGASGGLFYLVRDVFIEYYPNQWGPDALLLTGFALAAAAQWPPRGLTQS